MTGQTKTEGEAGQRAARAPRRGRCWLGTSLAALCPLQWKTDRSAVLRDSVSTAACGPRGLSSSLTSPFTHSLPRWFPALTGTRCAGCGHRAGSVPLWLPPAGKPAAPDGRSAAETLDPRPRDGVLEGVSRGSRVRPAAGPQSLTGREGRASDTRLATFQNIAPIGSLFFPARLVVHTPLRSGWSNLCLKLEWRCPPEVGCDSSMLSIVHFAGDV